MTQPAPAVPVCYRHPGRETYVRCTRCDRPICPDCMTEASVGHQCPECVAEGRRTVRPARPALGPVRFAALYLISGLGGSVAAYLFQPDAPTAGASGAIYGLFAALVLILRRLGRSTSMVIPVIVINFIFTFAVPGISIAGHVG